MSLVATLAGVVEDLKTCVIALRATEYPSDTRSAAGNELFIMGVVCVELETDVRRGQQSGGAAAVHADLLGVLGTDRS